MYLFFSFLKLGSITEENHAQSYGLFFSNRDRTLASNAGTDSGVADVDFGRGVKCALEIVLGCKGHSSKRGVPSLTHNQSSCATSTSLLNSPHTLN
ncbi:hypothetical protein HanIR_Chr07g0337251 [Helianthus annuus]|nr:hypothetical protein HanIR_Chr07g0337251 [Helianthus annuus]